MSVVCFLFVWLACLDVDEEQFEDNPEEYIRRDIEGSGMSLLASLINLNSEAPLSLRQC